MWFWQLQGFYQDMICLNGICEEILKGMVLSLEGRKESHLYV
jgi:hypothetical protein